MLTPWNPPTPLEILFTQIEDGALYAEAGGDPVSDAFKARKVAAILYDSGRFPIDHREWRAKTTAEQTFANVKTHFRKADLDRRKLELTTSGAGYHQNLANHAAAIQAKQTELDATLTENAMFRALLCQPANTTTTTDDSSVAMSAITALQASQTSTADTLAALLAANIANVPGQTAPRQTFCWTHGCSSNIHHTSMSCRNQAPGHQVTATIDNKMGGSEKIWTGPRAPA
jgi:hypothetical protein